MVHLNFNGGVLMVRSINNKRICLLIAVLFHATVCSCITVPKTQTQDAGVKSKRSHETRELTFLVKDHLTRIYKANDELVFSEKPPSKLGGFLAEQVRLIIRLRLPMIANVFHYHRICGARP